MNKTFHSKLNVWSRWTDPDSWHRSSVPESPGVYQLAVFRQGRRERMDSVTPKAEWPPERLDRIQAVDKEYRGIVYIGKAVCLKERFWRLIRSWQLVPTKNLHDSRDTYNKNHRNSQGLFGPREVRCRYKQLSTINWPKLRSRQRAAKNPNDIASLLTFMWPDSGQDRSKPSAAATFSMEGRMLDTYECWYGNRPLLNKAGAEVLGSKPTESWLEQYFLEQELFDDILDENVMREMAYFNWISRGCPPRDDWNDWFAVERATWNRILTGES